MSLADYALALEGGNVGILHANLPQNLVRVLAQCWWCRSYAGRSVRKFHGRID